MRSGRWSFFVAAGGALLLMSPGRDLHAQATISGRVTATTSNAPLADTRIVIIGSTLSATTGEDGRYTLRNVPTGAVQIQALRVGYQSQKKSVTVAAGAAVTADFAMDIAVVQLQEVVTTATGQQRRVEIGNAVSTLGDVSKRVEETPINNVADLLVAKSPGTIVLPGTVTGGAPVIRIRGLNSISLNNQPIFIVDGTRINASTNSAGVGGTSFSMLSSINPEEIEDIEIVKGPSAATLYGTDAANGVVVITTKKGRSGATRWNWFAEEGGVSDRNNYQAQYANWGHAPGSTTPIRCTLAIMNTSKFTSTAPAAQQCVSDSLTSYNLMADPSVTFVHLGRHDNYGGSVSGGTDQVRYFISSDYTNETGPIKMPDFAIQRFDSLHVGVRDEWVHPEALQQTNIRANITAALSPKVDLTFNTGFVKQDNRLPQSDNNILSLYSAGMQTYGFKGAGLDNTNIGALGEDLHGYLLFSPGEIMQVLRTQDVQRMTGSATANWRPFSWMANEGTVGVDAAARENFSLCRLNECPAFGTTRQGTVTDLHTSFRTLTSKLTSNSTWNVNSWANLKTTFGGDYTNAETDFSSAGGTVLPAGAQTSASAANKTASNQQPTATKTLGYYGQEQLSLRDRLFLTLAVRQDRNSAFGSNFSSVTYPKASVSYIVSDESFFPKFSWLDQLRLRSAYGSTGVQPTSTAALITFNTTTDTRTTPGGIAGTDQPGLRANQLGNADLKPELSSELEAGFESRMFSNKVNLDFTYYHKKTKDALINVPIAPSSAASQLTRLQNIGSVLNKGVEAQINASIIDRRSLTWNVTLSGSHNTNKVLDLGIDPLTGNPRSIGTGTTRQKVGYPLNGQWYRPYTYNDDNGDGVIQVSEVHVSPDTGFVFRGYSFPRDLFSAQSTFGFFGDKLRINTLFDYKGGYVLTDNTNGFICNQAPQACRENQDPSAPLWQQARNVAQNNGTTVNGTNFKTAQGYAVSGQFWKFRELSAIISLPNSWAAKIRSRDASLQLGARNLWWWGPYTGVDPESNQTVNDVQFDFIQASPPTYFTARLNLHY